MKVTFNKRKLFRRGYFSARLRLTSVTLLSGLGASALAFGGVSAGFPVVRETKETKDSQLFSGKIETKSFLPLLPFVIDGIIGLGTGVAGAYLKDYLDGYSDTKGKMDEVSSKLDTVIELLKKKEEHGLLEKLYALRDGSLLQLRQVDDLKEQVDDFEAKVEAIADATDDTKTFLAARDLLDDIRSLKRSLFYLKQDIYANLQEIYSLIIELL